MRLFVFVFLVLSCSTVLLGCGQPQATPDQTQAPATELPPGFTDEPPAGPTSSTTVLSGGILYSEDTFEDAAIVITAGKLVSWGTRGEVDMPNDSIGVDMRGKWITPGVQNPDGSLTLRSMPQNGEEASFLIFSDQPAEQPDTAALVGWFARGELMLEEAESG